jgi:hypothetical protein
VCILTKYVKSHVMLYIDIVGRLRNCETECVNTHVMLYMYIDIVGRVRNGETECCRPDHFDETADIQPAMYNLMNMSWEEDPHTRPHFTAIRSYLRRHNKHQLVAPII